MRAKAPHFAVNRNDLVRELSLALGAVERRSTIPILQHVKLEASDFGHLAITATDLEIGITSQCEATVKAPGCATLPAKRLLDYIRLLPDEAAEIKFTDTWWSTITAGRARTRIAGMSVESFPELPTPGETRHTIPLRQLARLIQQTQYAISIEESRFTLNGALLEAEGDHLRMVATDGHRLTLAEIPATDVKIEGKQLVPRKALQGIVRLAGISAADATVEFAADENHLFFSVGDRILTVRRLTGNFPDYARVLPKQFSGTAVVNRQEMKDALNRVRNFADERSRAVTLTVNGDSIQVASKSTETGESEDSVAAEITGEGLTIGFNADYLFDFLGATDSEKVTLHTKDSNSPMQLTPANGDGRYLCVIMPQRV
ncbi:MAG: DNA polymerase III subunit beta [Bryobacterales bacterium]|nr:DNA polymerase III subunit beta [Bryobacterales bacterium]